MFDANGGMLADSGSPATLDADALLHRGLDDDRGHRDRSGLPNPLGGGLFGSSGSSRSARTLDMPISGGGGEYVQLSEAPASGSDALLSAAEAWILAAALAVALAALAGYLVSARISRPVVALTEASDRMAEGDLGARAPVVGTRRGRPPGRRPSTAWPSRVESTVTSLRRFVADAAHEIGTPLTALQADLELAERKADSDDERRLVGRALVQTHRLGTLSDNLLQLSRLEAGEPAGGRESFDLAVLTREAADSIASRAEQAGIELELAIAETPLVVSAERPRIQAALGNLLDNALKFTPEGGRVSLGARAEGGSALVTVADTGVGIPPEEQAEVFGRFHRGRNVSAYPGNGLGLAIVKAAVERSGGTVSFTSSPRAPSSASRSRWRAT